LTVSRVLRSISDFRTARRFVRAACEHLDEVGGEVRDELEVERAFLDWMDPAQRPEVVPRVRHLRARTGSHGTADANLLLLLAFDALEGGGLDEGELTGAPGGTGPQVARDLALEVVRGHRSVDRPEPGLLPAALTVLVGVDELEAAVEAADAAIAVARAQHTLVQVGEAATFRALAHYRLGRLAEAEADARLAHALAHEIQSRSARRHTLTWLVRCLVERELLEDAEAALEEAGSPGSLAYLSEARGHLRAAQGRFADALAEFTAAGERASVQLRHPGLVTWQPAAALALHHLGRHAEARQQADDAVRIARRYGSGRALGLALRARGLVSGEVADLRDAVATLASLPAALEHARALVDLGAALRRTHGRGEGRSCLERGMDQASACGADALVARAGEELVALGARPRRTALTGPHALTPSERRVVGLAAGGLTNRAIAQSLFVTTKTVETHLAAAYRKLGISGRSELRGALP
jgi:DNA-binding CsgD family transcriptional regulator